MLGGVGLAAGVLLVAASSAVSASAPQTAASYIQIAGAADNAAGSVHIDVTENKNGKVTIIKFDENATEGKEAITLGKERGALLAFPGMAYVKGNTDFLENYVGIPKRAAANHSDDWISITSSFTNYGNLVLGSTLAAITALVPSAKSATLGSPTTRNGKRVVAISGTTTGTAAGVAFGADGTQTVYVLEGQPYNAVGYHLHSRYTEESPKGFENVHITLNATLTHWGERVVITPPASAVPIATLVGSQ